MQYIPTIYGFKIFGQKGSKYEIIYDNLGAPKNQKEIDTVLKKKYPAAGGSMMGGGGVGTLAQISGATSALQGTGASSVGDGAHQPQGKQR